MLAVTSLLVVAAFSIATIRVGAVALVMTGLTRDVARFQALSAFTGAGFTTAESENVVDHPARRRVVSALIRFGAGGLVAGLAAVLLATAGGGATAPPRLGILAAGGAALLVAARSQALDRAVTPFVARVLARSADLDIRDYAALLHIHDDYHVARVEVAEGSWLDGRALRDLGDLSVSVGVLGVLPVSGDYVGVPRGGTTLRVGDTVTVYGTTPDLEAFSSRGARG